MAHGTTIGKVDIRMGSDGCGSDESRPYTTMLMLKAEGGTDEPLRIVEGSLRSSPCLGGVSTRNLHHEVECICPTCLEPYRE